MAAAAVLLLVALAATASAASAAASSAPLRVLFIGNSFTYVNDLPDLFAQVSELNSLMAISP